MDVTERAFGLLGEGTIFQTRDRSSLAYWRQIQSGLPVDSFELVVQHVPTLDRPRWRRLVNPDGADQVLPPSGSEKAGRLAFILALAVEVWGGWKAADKFLSRPHRQLSDLSPIQAAESEWGAREVESLLRKIQFGLPA